MSFSVLQNRDSGVFPGGERPDGPDLLAHRKPLWPYPVDAVARSREEEQE